MSFFNWFRNKLPAHGPQPLANGARASAPAKDAGATQPSPRKSERLARRELLYAVVREGMAFAGVLSSSYKFKVLSMDPRGRQYIVMMDLSAPYGDHQTYVDVEAFIAKKAKARHDILVTAMYWRVTEQVTAGLIRAPHAISRPAPLNGAMEAEGGQAGNRPGFEPLHADQVAAFKAALAGVSKGRPLSAPGQIIQSGRRNPTPPIDFEDTERAPNQSPLSGTQYGDLE